MPEDLVAVLGSGSPKLLLVLDSCWVGVFLHLLLQTKALNTPASLARQVTVMTSVGNIGRFHRAKHPVHRAAQVQAWCSSSSSSWNKQS